MPVSLLDSVRESCSWVADQAENVTIDDEKIAVVVQEMQGGDLDLLCQRKKIDTELHFMDDSPLTIQYLLVLDALNFCFWPDEELEYGILALGLKQSVEEDASILDADKLATIDGAGIRNLIGLESKLPNEDERARLVREIGVGLQAHFDGKAINLIQAANKNASKLVELVTGHFPGFRDHCIYKGKQVFLYKRAQIFVGDVWGSFGGAGLGEFSDIEDLTMFADYRVPVVLKDLGMLKYSEELDEKIANLEELEPGCKDEVEIRACSIVAVERLKARIRATHGENCTPHSVQLDWWLWEKGEAAKDQHPPHHRTSTIYY